MKKNLTLSIFIIASCLLSNCRDNQEKSNTEQKNIKIETMKNENHTEYKAIEKALQSYLVSPNTAKASGLKEDWYKHLLVIGEINDNNVEMTRNEFINLIESHEATPETKGRIVAIDLEKNAACVKLEFFTPSGFRFTDYILMYKENGSWKASSKVFDSNIHYNKQTQENTYSEYERIEQTLNNYIDAAKSGKGESIKAYWLENAIVVVEYGVDIIKIHSNDFAQAITHQGVASKIDTKIISIDYNGKAAYAKLSINNWLGANYTDYLVLHKQGNRWLVCGKVYDVN